MKTLQNIEEIKMIFYSKIARDHTKVLHAEDAYRLLISDWNSMDKEQQFRMLMLDEKFHLLSSFNFSKSGISKVIDCPELLFNTVPTHRATSMILAHNHPSGNIEPDVIELTRALLRAARSTGLVVMDHLIVAPGNFFSALGEEYQVKSRVPSRGRKNGALRKNGTSRSNRKINRDEKE